MTWPRQHLLTAGTYSNITFICCQPIEQDMRLSSQTPPATLCMLLHNALLTLQRIVNAAQAWQQTKKSCDAAVHWSQPGVTQRPTCPPARW